MPPQLEKNHVVPTACQDEALARDGVSREVPCSALKGDLPDFKQAEQTLSSVSGMEKCKGCVLLTGCCVGHSPHLRTLPELRDFPGLRFPEATGDSWLCRPCSPNAKTLS